MYAGGRKAASLISSLQDGASSLNRHRRGRNSVDSFSQGSFPAPPPSSVQQQPSLMTHHEQQQPSGAAADSGNGSGGGGFLAGLFLGFRSRPGSVLGSINARRSVGSIDGSSSTMFTADVEEGGLKGLRSLRRQKKMKRQARCVTLQ